MTKRLHLPALDQTISGAAGPSVEPSKREFRTPAEMADEGRKAALVDAPQPGLGAEVIDQYDLASRFDHAGELVEGGLRIRHRGDHELRHHDIEERICKTELFGVHHGKHVDVAERAPAQPGLGAAEHWFGKIDADNPIAGRILGKRNPSADADVENASAMRSAALTAAARPGANIGPNTTS